MAIERVGQFIEFMVPGENGGIRALARINAIQLVTETDCLGDALSISVGGRTFQIDCTLEQMRDLLFDDSGRRPGSPHK